MLRRDVARSILFSTRKKEPNTQFHASFKNLQKCKAEDMLLARSEIKSNSPSFKCMGLRTKYFLNLIGIVRTAHQTLDLLNSLRSGDESVVEEINEWSMISTKAVLYDFPSQISHVLMNIYYILRGNPLRTLNLGLSKLSKECVLMKLKV